MNAHTVLSFPDMAFAREPLETMLEDGLRDMLTDHWKEVAHDKDAIALNPDWNRYFHLEREGGFVAYGLRKGGHLIGYTAFFVNRALHYRDHIFALNDVVYLQPKHRGLDGIVMILESERGLKARGVTKVFYHAKTDAFLGESDDSLAALEKIMELEELYDIKIADDAALDGSTLGNVLQAVGYRHVEETWGKLLRG